MEACFLSHGHVSSRAVLLISFAAVATNHHRAGQETQIYYLRFLEVRGPKWDLQGLMQVVGRAVFSLEA